MGTTVGDVPKIIRSEGRQSEPDSAVSWGRSAAWGVLAGGIAMLLGVLVDLGVLWLLQYEATPQWEFSAVANTVESVPRLLFGLAFVLIALHMMGSTRAAWYRLLGTLLIMVGVLSVGLGLLLVLSYFPLSKLMTQPAVYTMFRSVAIKTIALCGLYAVTAVPLGVLSLRRPRR